MGQGRTRQKNKQTCMTEGRNLKENYFLASLSNMYNYELLVLTPPTTTRTCFMLFLQSHAIEVKRRKKLFPYLSSAARREESLLFMWKRRVWMWDIKHRKEITFKTRLYTASRQMKMKIMTMMIALLHCYWIEKLKKMKKPRMLR